MKDDNFEEELRNANMNDAVRRTQRLERELIASKAKAESNENMAAWLEKFIQKGQARINEAGEVELMDPKWLDAKVPVVHKKQQQQQSQ